MEYEKIKQLMEDMGNSKLLSLDIDFPDGTKISMKKENSKEAITENKKDVILCNKESIIDVKKDEIDEDLNYILSPMVGTFYTKPSPDSEPYINIGDNVSQGKTVCIIEAMKLMNEIESEYNGKIVEVYVKDGETVEYGTKLFAVK